MVILQACRDNLAAAGIERRTRYKVAAPLLDGQRFARQHGLVDGAVTFEHDAVDRDPLARAHAQAVAAHDRFQ